MAKRQYHCLDGVLRDIVHAFDADSDEAWERLTMLARYIAECLEILEGDDDTPDDSGMESDGADSGGESDEPLDVRESRRSPTLGGLAPGYGPVRQPPLGGTPGLDAQVGGVRAAQLANGILPREPGAVGGARGPSVILKD